MTHISVEGSRLPNCIGATGALVGYLSLTFLCNCSVTAPILVEPRAPQLGDLRIQTGAAALVPIAGDDQLISRARNESGSGTTGSPLSGDSSASGATAMVLAARPGVAPVVRGFVGVGKGIEAGLRYGGRDVGVSARFVILESRGEQAGARTLSIGFDGKAVLPQRADDATVLGLSVENLRGFGGSVPIVAAIQSDAGLMFGYVGAAVGVDAIHASVAYPGWNDARVREASISRVWGAGTIGIGLGFRRLHVITELGFQRDLISASIEARATVVRLYSLTPAFGISMNF
ncbi:MAG: hypothetical protein NVSMB1_15210 [Polyangiales bacterium]